MRCVALVPVLLATLALLPERGTAQLALADGRFWAAPRAGVRQSVWRLAAPASQANRAPTDVRVKLARELPGLPRLDWRGSDVALAGAFTVALLVDAAQTRSLARGGWSGFRESNPRLGPRPSVGRVNVYTAVAGLTVLGAANALPRRYRPWLLATALAVQAFTIQSSLRQGIPLRF